MAYADEDHRGSLKELYGIEDTHCCAEYRGAPWFKPDFSPDTLVSFFYIGSVFAIRGSKILEMTGKYGSDSSIYELVYRIFMQELDRRRQGKAQGIVHMPKVLYTNDSLEDTEQTDSSEKIRQLDLADDRSRGAQDKVSVIIPSKDNADVLRKCMETLVRYTDYSCYELIIVDNGSSPEQKKCITHCIEGLKREKKDLVIRYLYQECAFNFSAMCNIRRNKRIPRVIRSSTRGSPTWGSDRHTSLAVWRMRGICTMGITRETMICWQSPRRVC